MIQVVRGNQRFRVLEDAPAGAVGRFGLALLLADRCAGGGAGAVFGFTITEGAAWGRIFVGGRVRPARNPDEPDGEKRGGTDSAEFGERRHAIVLIHGAARRDRRKVPVTAVFWI